MEEKIKLSDISGHSEQNKNTVNSCRCFDALSIWRNDKSNLCLQPYEYVSLGACVFDWSTRCDCIVTMSLSMPHPLTKSKVKYMQLKTADFMLPTTLTCHSPRLLSYSIWPLSAIRFLRWCYNHGAALHEQNLIARGHNLRYWKITHKASTQGHDLSHTSRVLWQ